MPNQHVVPHSKGWAVKTAGGKTRKVCATQKEAIKNARSVAKNQRSELVIHNRKGRIRERNTYGRDPYPPTG